MRATRTYISHISEAQLINHVGPRFRRTRGRSRRPASITHPGRNYWTASPPPHPYRVELMFNIAWDRGREGFGKRVTFAQLGIIISPCRLTRVQPPHVTFLMKRRNSKNSNLFKRELRIRVNAFESRLNAFAFYGSFMSRYYAA